MSENLYDEVTKLLQNARPIGKGVVFSDGKIYELDYNYNPPRVREIKVEVEYPTIEEIERIENEEQ